MGLRFLITALVLIRLHAAHGQDFVQHHVPNDTVSGEPPVVGVLPNGEVWAAWATQDIRTSPWTSRLHIRKLDAAGQLLLANDLRFPNPGGWLQLSGATVLPDDGVALYGHFDSQGVLIRVDANAGLVAVTHMSMSTFGERFSDVLVRPDGSLMVLGWCRTGGEQLPYVVRTDANGVLVDAWSDRIPGMEGAMRFAKPTPDGGTLLFGSHFASVDSSGMQVVKLNSTGAMEWGRSLAARQLVPVQALQRTDGGWLVLAEQLIQQGVLSGAPMLLRMDADGTLGTNRRIWADQQSSSPYSTSSLDRLPDGTMVACARVGALDGTVLFTLDSTGTPEPSARLVPDSGLVTAFRALAMANGDLLLRGARVAPAMGLAAPLIARWDPANAIPCGSTTVPVLSDSIVPVLDSTFVRVPLSPTVVDITAQIVPDNITWTVSDPCAISTGVQAILPVGGTLRVFPDPAVDRVQVEGLAGMQELLLLDAQGAVVARWASPFPQVMELPAVADGLYFMRATNGKGVRSARLMVLR